MAKPGPRGQASNIVDLNGNPGHRPPRDDVKPEPIAPKAPSWMSKRGKSVWKYLAPELEKNALLTKRDREAFAFLCEDAAICQTALLKMREGSEYKLLEDDRNHPGSVRRHPAFIIYNQAIQSFRRWCAEFGLTPSARVGLIEGGGFGAAATRAGVDAEDDEALFS